MDQGTLDNAKFVMAEREKAVLSSKNPRQAAIEYLAEVGFLNSDGSISEKYGGAIQDSKKPAAKTREKLTL